MIFNIHDLLSLMLIIYVYVNMYFSKHPKQTCFFLDNFVRHFFWAFFDHSV